MKCVRLLGLLLGIVAMACSAVGQAVAQNNFVTSAKPYMTVFKPDAEHALAVLNDSVQIRQVLEAALHDEHLVHVALAVVLPEISQFTYLEDVAMKEPLKPLYIKYEVDRMSFGLLQMRPGFAEDVEERLAGNPQLARQFADLCRYRVKEPEKVRAERLNRLENLRSQTRYLAAFILLAQEKIRAWNIKDPRQQVRYFATLYNGGLDLDQNDITLLQKKTQFPHGKLVRYNYSAIALEFYDALSARGR